MDVAQNISTVYYHLLQLHHIATILSIRYALYYRRSSSGC